MDKMIYSGSIVVASALIAGSLLMPDNAGMWLASTSLAMNIMRGVIIGLMVGLLVTNPPRRREFRLLLGAVSLSFMMWAFGHLWYGSTMVIDSLLFLEAAVSFGLAALEGQPFTVPATERLSATGSRLGATSSMQGLVIPQARLANFVRQAFIAVAIITGIVYKNARPLRVVWHGG